MAETTEVAKTSTMTFFIGLFFVLIVAALVVRSVKFSIKKKSDEEEEQ